MENLTNWLEQNLASSPLVALAVALAAGVLISFTPCVYPVLGPTVAFVGARAAGSRLRAFTLSLTYGLGMAIMYAALGAFAALTGRMFGQFTANNPWVQGLIGAVCLLMGLSMLDVFVLRMPGGAQSLYSKRFGGAYVNALAAGAVFALIPASCAAPVLLVILAFVAVGKNLLYGISLLFAFGIGVSVLVVLVGTFAGLLAALPKSGAWMDRIKHGMGWAMIVLGVYFFFHAGQVHGGRGVIAPPPVAQSGSPAAGGTGTEPSVGPEPAAQIGSPAAGGTGTEPSVGPEPAAQIGSPAAGGTSTEPSVGPEPAAGGTGTEPSVGPEPTAQIGDREGMTAPDFILPTLEGASASLSQYRGQVVLLNFWASWCPGCMQEVPELRRLYEKYHDQGLQVVAVNASESPGAVAQTVQNESMPYSIILAPQGAQVWDDYHVVGIPENLLIDRSGAIVYRGGAIPGDIDERITQLLRQN